MSSPDRQLVQLAAGTSPCTQFNNMGLKGARPFPPGAQAACPRRTFNPPQSHAGAVGRGHQ